MKKLALLVSIAAAVFGAPAAYAANNVTVGHSSWFWGNPQPQGNTLNAIDFAGGTGYAAGDFGTLLKTADNGFTWTGISTGITVTLNQVRLLDANTVFIGAGCLLRRSDDGGTTFKRILATSSERRCPASVTSFYFTTPLIGYVLLSDARCSAPTTAASRSSSAPPCPGRRRPAPLRVHRQPTSGSSPTRPGSRRPAA